MSVPILQVGKLSRREVQWPTAFTASERWSWGLNSGSLDFLIKQMLLMQLKVKCGW